MSLTKVIKQGDLANLIEMEFQYSINPDDLDIPIDTPCSMFIVNMDTGLPLTEGGTTAIQSSTGGILTVLYSPGGTDTAVPGRYRAELRLTLNSKLLTIPTVYYLNILVLPKLS